MRGLELRPRWRKNMILVYAPGLLPSSAKRRGSRQIISRDVAR